jgi:hypothetical protein
MTVVHGVQEVQTGSGGSNWFKRFKQVHGSGSGFKGEPQKPS